MKAKYFLPIAVLVICGCSTNKQAVASYSSTSVECLGVELDGSQTLRVFATGRGRSDALEQARKVAVNEVLFSGVRTNNRGCDMRPLVNEANARDKYASYFNSFFTDGGAYLKYVSSEDERRWTKKREKGKQQVRYGLTVRVLRPQLKQRLIADGIIKQ